MKVQRVTCSNAPRMRTPSLGREITEGRASLQIEHVDLTPLLLLMILEHSEVFSDVLIFIVSLI